MIHRLPSLLCALSVLLALPALAGETSVDTRYDAWDNVSPGEIRGVWASTHLDRSCESPRRDHDGAPVYLTVTDTGFYYGETIQCGFGGSLGEPVSSIDGDMPCRGQQGDFSGFFNIEADPDGQTLTFQQGTGSARFIQTMEICYRSVTE